jgi:hypothetical protein
MKTIVPDSSKTPTFYPKSNYFFILTEIIRINNAKNDLRKHHFELGG